MINDNKQNIAPANYSPPPRPPRRPKLNADTAIQERFMNEELLKHTSDLKDKKVVLLEYKKTGTYLILSQNGLQTFKSEKERSKKIEEKQFVVVKRNKWVNDAHKTTIKRLDDYHDIQRTMVDIAAVLKQDKRDNVLLFIDGRDGVRRKVTKINGKVEFSDLNKDASSVLAAMDKKLTQLKQFEKDDIVFKALENRRDTERGKNVS